MPDVPPRILSEQDHAEFAAQLRLLRSQPNLDLPKESTLAFMEALIDQIKHAEKLLKAIYMTRVDYWGHHEGISCPKHALGAEEGALHAIGQFLGNDWLNRVVADAQLEESEIGNEMEAWTQDFIARGILQPWERGHQCSG